MKYIQAKHCGPERKHEPVRLIVIHTMEAPEKPRTATNVALWFAGEKAPQASAHYCIDADEIVLCVKENTIAWGAPGANKNGIHLEHAGFAKQSPAEWADGYTMRMLERSAALAADIATRHNIPTVKVTSQELFTNPKATGFCGHVDVTNGRNAGKGHFDPGPHFPWDAYLELVRGFQQVTDPNIAIAGEAPTSDGSDQKNG